MPRSITVLENDFDADSTDADASIVGGARKRLKISLLNVPCLILFSLRPLPLLFSLFFLPLFLPSPLTTFRKDTIKCAPITRENLVTLHVYSL